MLETEEKAAYDFELRKKLNAETDVDDLAGDSERCIALDQAVQQAEAQMTVKWKRLSPQAQQAAEPERQASILVQYLQNELSRRHR